MTTVMTATLLVALVVGALAFWLARRTQVGRRYPVLPYLLAGFALLSILRDLTRTPQDSTRFLVLLLVVFAGFVSLLVGHWRQTHR